MAEFQSKFTGQEVDNTINKLRSWIAVDGTYPTVTISGVTYAVIWKSIPVSGTACYGIGLHPTTGRIYEIYYNGSSYTATALDNDTKNTAGSTNSTSKLFLVGAGSQGTNPQTYSNSQVYTQDGKLYSNNEAVVTSSNLDNYLPLSGGANKPLAGPVYIAHNDLSFIGTVGAFGFRAAAQSGQSLPHLGQINLSKNFGGDGNQYGIQMSAVDITNNRFNQFRVYQLGIAYQHYDIASKTATDVFTVDTAGQLDTAKIRVAKKATMQYNSTEECIEFIFA